MNFSAQAMLAFEECDNSIEFNLSEQRVPRVEPHSLQEVKFLKKGKFGKVYLVRVLGGELSSSSSSPSLLEQSNPHSSGNNPTFPSEAQDHETILLAAKFVNPNAIDPIDAAMQLVNEAKILTGLNHENIVQLKGLCAGGFSESFLNHDRGYFLLLEYLEDTLQCRMDRWRSDKRKSPKRICSKLAKQVSKLLPFAVTHRDRDTLELQRQHHRLQEASAVGIARGFEYLHSQQIVLRDLKPANIGYYRNTTTSNSNPGRRTHEWTVKLIDFGMAKKVNQCKPGEYCGSLAYIAPEAMRGEIPTLKADVFSLGVLVAEISSLGIPYPKSRKKPRRMSNEDHYDSFRDQVAEEGLQPMSNLNAIIPCHRTRAIIKQCWRADPIDRPSCTDIHIRLESILRSHSSYASAKISRDLTESYTEDNTN